MRLILLKHSIDVRLAAFEVGDLEARYDEVLCLALSSCLKTLTSCIFRFFCMLYQDVRAEESSLSMLGDK